MTRTSRTLTLVLAVAAMFMLAACGDGGGSGTGTTDTSKPTNTSGVSPTQDTGTLPGGTDPTPENGVSPTSEPGGGGTGTGNGSFSSASSALRFAKGYHFVFSSETSGGKPYTAEGDFDYSDVSAISPKLRFTVSGTGTGNNGIDGDWIKITGDKMYRKVGGEWQKESLSAGSPLLDIVELAGEPSNANPLKKDGEPELVGTETVDGEETNHYQFTAGSYNYAAWVSKRTGKFVRIERASKSGTGKGSVTYSKWDQVEPVEEPK